MRNELGSIPRSTANQLGAVVGYGFALQAYCLEGFDFPGLHQVISLKRYQVAYTVWGRVVQVRILVGRPVLGY